MRLLHRCFLLAAVGRSAVDCADASVIVNPETGLPDGMTPLDFVEQRERRMEAKNQRVALEATARKPFAPFNGSIVYPRINLPLRAPAGASPDACNPHTQIQAHKLWIQTDAGYNDARMKQYAQYLGTHEEAQAALRPTVLVYCKSELHVQSAVLFANICGYKVTVRSGGHSYTGSSACNFGGCMQLDLGAMNETSFHGTTIKSGPGINLLEFAKKTWPHLLSVPHGGCSYVGMGGHFQSSAWGMQTNSHGSGMDHIISFRLVMADATVRVVSRDDANKTLYHSILGSAPGSWGIITEYTLEGIRDTSVPWTRAFTVRLTYSKAAFIAAFKQTQFIVKDQEAKNLRDMKVLLVTAPPTEGAESEDNTVYIDLYGLWTGIDSGRMTKAWHDLYLKPFYAWPHSGFPSTINLPAPLSLAGRMFANMWTNHHDRYAIQAFHSDHWWDDEFIEIMATEVDERVAMIPEVYPSFQFLPVGSQSTWARNAHLNSLTWRDVRAYVDDWMMIKNDSRYEEIRTRMRNFRERTRKYWAYKDGTDRSTWMTPMTTYDNSTDLSNETIVRGFFPNYTLFEQLQLVKAEVDPTDLFSNKGTIPLPRSAH